MAHELQEARDLAPGGLVRFPHGRGVLWTITWTHTTGTGVWINADSGLVTRTWQRDAGFQLHAVV